MCKLSYVKIYTVLHASEKIGVSRQTLHSWIRKKWVTPKKDYRNYPVFSEEDIKKIIAWRKELKDA